MKKSLCLQFLLTVIAMALASQWATAQTVFFTDDFSNGSTTNLASVPGGTPTASSTCYDIASPKNTIGGTTIAPNDFHLALNAATTSAFHEAQALFAGAPISLNQVGDYVEIVVVFTNTTGSLLVSDSSTPNSQVWIGLYDSGGNAPLSGGVLAGGALNSSAGSPYATGNCANWQGYVAQVSSNGVSRIVTRPIQNGSGTASANQDVIATTGAGSAGYNNPGASSIATGPTAPVSLANNAPSTLYLRVTLTGPTEVTISNAIYSGAGTGGTILYSQIGVASGSTFLTSSFDGLAIGASHRTVSGGTGRNPVMDISSIQISGQSSAAGIPNITSQPVPTTVATNGSCAFYVTANGLNLTYQWHRNGTNLIDGGNISGASSDTLIITSAGSADALSGGNGYYVTVTSPGGSTNSITNALAVVSVTNLTWNANAGATWDVGSTASWSDTNGNNSLTFTYGDPVTFDDSGANRFVTLSGNYLSASSVTVNSASGFKYTFLGSGSFAGPGNLIFAGTGQLDIKNANSYSGGTIVSNSNDEIYLENYNGLGTGPITFAKAGSLIEITTSGGASTGIPGDLIVNDNATIQIDGTGSYGSVFYGNLSGVSGKTLTFNPVDVNTLSSTTTNRIRIYGAATTNDANIVLNGPAVSQANYYGTCLTPYNSSGVQRYNGVISGNGGIVQRANGTTILAGQNTYAGGTTPTAGNIAFGADSTGTPGNVSSGPIGTGPLFIAPEIPNSSGSGTVLAYGVAHTVGNPLLYPSGTNNQTLIVGGTNDLTFTGPVWLNGLDGLGTVGSRTFQVDNSGLTTISGVIADTNSAGWGFTKSGSGKLLLTATETYTGPTLVTGGKLKVNGSLNAASAVTVTNGGLLGGSGTVNGAVTIAKGGGLAPGENATATFTINNNLTILGGSTNAFKVDKGLGNKDVVVVTGTAAYAGTLLVTNLSGTLAAGDNFKIFNVTGAPSGNFTNIVGGPLSPGLGFSFTNSTGTLWIVQSVATNPTNITFSVTGGNTLNLSWPADHTGWTLQVQTNSLATGLTTNGWFDVPNSTGINSTNFTINPDNGSVFYRLIYQ
ncbi:MAG TPA: autotransporter-associated beta strand repeat-containing protein [Verrucomicrobiae bacterium]|nr:autotransporter-associated beta strand repeat-containing protein [Verrucomicrobiae bacterium]